MDGTTTMRFGVAGGGHLVILPEGSTREPRYEVDGVPDGTTAADVLAALAGVAVLPLSGVVALDWADLAAAPRGAVLDRRAVMAARLAEGAGLLARAEARVRGVHGWQAALARECGIPRQRVWEAVQGRRPLTADQLDRLRAALAG